MFFVVLILMPFFYNFSREKVKKKNHSISKKKKEYGLTHKPVGQTLYGAGRKI